MKNNRIQNGAIVTGASRGIGRAISVELARAGFDVHGTGRDEQALAETQALCPSPGTFRPHAVDIRSTAEVEALVAGLERLDLCVNNAAILYVDAFVDASLEEFREMLDVNVLGAFVVMRAAARRMLREGGGRIVDIASDVSVKPSPEGAGYAATKHALAGLSKTLAEEMLGRGVQVSTVYPGAVDTEIHGHTESRQGYMDAVEVARVIVSGLLACGTTACIRELHLQPIMRTR